MKIEIKVDNSIEETSIHISCNQLTPELEKLIAMMRIMERKFVVSAEGEIFLLDVSEILYIEAVDRKTFVYTEDPCDDGKWGSDHGIAAVCGGIETKTWSNGLECREVFDCTESNRIIVKQFRM